MTKNELAYKIASAKKALDQMEAEYKVLCAKYLKAGGKTIVIDSLGVKINVVNPENTEYDNVGFVKHMIKIGKVKELAASINVVNTKLVANTDKVFAAEMAKRFACKVDGSPYIKVMAA